ncbi:E3 ubiquitin-protein ligase SGR9, amyloplastic-like [Phragmites australis]|uniref:E3 ubiquitin-protein ligase SGR9, amyloplastic-like n=1 Tax=Phragmites australis TaxID=29695 RepID=UPI002D790ADE|nr:E3 ubiquitin-protein ligase SGR9, amyloplastic-like [Phragmites australis]
MEASYSQSPPTPSSSETLMAALLAVPAAQLPSLARALGADARRLRCRLAFLLLSPPHFARALARLRSMPLPAKAKLLGRVLLRSLLLLLPGLCPEGYGGGSLHHLHLPHPDLDAALLLLAMCDSYSPAASSPSPVDWRAVIVDDVVASALSVSGLGATPWAALAPYVDAAAKCRRFADVVSEDRAAVGGIGKEGEGSRGASYAAVLALPPVAGDGAPCAICREEMAPGPRGVCALRPCGHRFHWHCALRWLARRNTCPCCRAELPSEDPVAETRRLWRAVERMARGG